MNRKSTWKPSTVSATFQLANQQYQFQIHVNTKSMIIFLSHFIESKDRKLSFRDDAMMLSFATTNEQKQQRKKKVSFIIIYHVTSCKFYSFSSLFIVFSISLLLRFMPLNMHTHKHGHRHIIANTFNSTISLKTFY